MISHQHRCICVHIPKTGGTSVENVLWPGPEENRSEQELWMGFVDQYHNRYQTGGLQHLLARHIRTEVGEAVFSRYFKFAFVRNPWDRAVSQYVYMAQREDLRESVHDLLARLGLGATSLPHDNRGDRGPYQDYYDDESRVRVGEMYAAGVRAFGYTFS